MLIVPQMHKILFSLTLVFIIFYNLSTSDLSFGYHRRLEHIYSVKPVLLKNIEIWSNYSHCVYVHNSAIFHPISKTQSILKLRGPIPIRRAPTIIFKAIFWRAYFWRSYQTCWLTGVT